MNKLFYILSILIFMLVVAIAVTIYIKNKDATSVHTEPFYTDLSVTLPSTIGSKIVIPNFLKDPVVVVDTQNPGLYHIGDTFGVSANGDGPLFVITYEKSSGYFNIMLLTKPFSSARIAAETYIKNILKIDESSLCGLSYTVSVPGYVDEVASGIDYRFSFCPGGVPL